jgi:hypothetical protein
MFELSIHIFIFELIIIDLFFIIFILFIDYLAFLWIYQQFYCFILYRF